MGNGPDDSSQKQTPTRPQAATQVRQRPFVWPESQTLEAQNGGASRMFRQNSERLQEAAAKRIEAGKEIKLERELTFARDRSPGRYQLLKEEQSRAVGAEQDRSPSAEKKLTFARDRSSPSQERQNQTQGDQSTRSLTFARDRGHSRDR